MPKADLGRLLTAVVTPFDAQGQVDYQMFRRLVAALVDSGTEGLVVTGTTGEGPTLANAEKLRLYREAREAVGSRAAIIAGTCNYSTAESIELSLEAARVGVEAILGTVPYYNNPPQEGLYRHFRAIAEAVDLPLLLYNVPSRTVRNMEADTTLRLAQLPNVVGIKEASGNLKQVGHIIHAAPPGFRVWSGNDQDTLAVLALGGYGVVSVASHLVGRQLAEMVQLCVQGRLPEAVAIHHRLMPFFDSLFIVANPIPVKHALNHVGFPVGKPRLPLIEADPKSAALIEQELARITIDLPVPAER